VSLRLQDVRVSDGGLYTCLVASRLWQDEARIALNVEGNSKFHFFFFYILSAKTRLECSSEMWSSRPEVTWRDMNGLDMTSASKLTFQRGDERLLRVRSVILIKWELNVFSCLMRSNTTRPAYQSKLGVYGEVLHQRKRTKEQRSCTRHN
uniref:Butyrophilin subfamily 3 member A2-like Ig-C domain-containing protein n=1 Tax=Erpetoichthys calabaricus TaxID=27687 RepID=A0A8C4T2L7_ERPCA